MPIILPNETAKAQLKSYLNYRRYFFLFSNTNDICISREI